MSNKSDLEHELGRIGRRREMALMANDDRISDRFAQAGKAKEEGQSAKSSGKTKNDNPYPKYSNSWSDWNAGFGDGAMDAQRYVARNTHGDYWSVFKEGDPVAVESRLTREQASRKVDELNRSMGLDAEVKKCERCNGTGKIAPNNTRYVDCPECGGTGKKKMATDASGYVVKRIGSYSIIEGTGPDGGDWFAKGNGGTVRFKSREEAERHATVSNDEENAALAGQIVKPAVEEGKAAAKPKGAQDAFQKLTDLDEMARRLYTSGYQSGSIRSWAIDKGYTSSEADELANKVRRLESKHSRGGFE